MKAKMFVIAGPTASGKSAFSLRLAKAVGGVVINADSLQVYEDVPILTARPTPAEQDGVPHELYGFLDAFQKSSVALWLEKVKEVLSKTQTAVFVGGTGLYLNALLHGLSPVPDIPPDIRRTVREMPLEEVRQKVQDRRFADPQRLRRALEVEQATGKTLAYWQTQPTHPLLTEPVQRFLILPPREKLYAQCNYRFTQMMAAGALMQVAELLKKNPEKSGGVFQAIGVSELSQVLAGTLSEAEAIAHAQQMTRNYAKRQATWFRHQFRADTVLESPDFSLSLLKDVDTM